MNKDTSKENQDIVNEFWNRRDMMTRYNISHATASNHMNKIIKIYKVNKTRLPKAGVLPAKIITDYFNKCYEEEK